MEGLSCWSFVFVKALGNRANAGLYCSWLSQAMQLLLFFLTKTFCSLHSDKLQTFRSVKGRNIHHRASNERLAHCNYSCNHIVPPFSFLLTPSSVQTVRSCKNDVGPCPEVQEHVRVPQGWILQKSGKPNLIKWEFSPRPDPRRSPGLSRAPWQGPPRYVHCWRVCLAIFVLLTYCTCSCSQVLRLYQGQLRFSITFD